MLCAAALATFAWAAKGHAECENGVRATTQAEQAALGNVLESVKRALPPAPQGWIIESDDEPPITNEICREVEQKPWFYDRSRTYRKKEGDEQRHAAITAAQQDLSADLASKQPRAEAIQARMQQLGDSIAEAAQKGDVARMQALSAESDKLS